MLDSSSILLNTNDLDKESNIIDSTERGGEKEDLGDFFSPLLEGKQLPVIFQEVYNYYDNAKERDIALMSLIAQLGAPLHNIRYVHGDRAYYPSFFLMVIAVSGDGKGVLEHVKNILTPLSRQLQDEYNQRLIEFKRKWAQWDAKGKKNGEPQPEPPAQPAAIIQAGTTTAGFYTTLEANGGWAVVNESEAFKMVEEQKNSWSQVNSIVRQALSNETISSTRATAGLSHTINDPRIGIAMGAQPNVPRQMYSSAALGDVQRITFLDIHKKQRVLYNKFIRSDKPLVADFYSLLGQSYLDIYNQMAERTSFIEYVATPEQSQKLFKFQKYVFNTFGECFGDVFDGKIVRIPHEMHNIIMLLTLLYRYQERKAEGRPLFEAYEQTLIADERALDICLTIMPVLLKHTVRVWQKYEWSKPLEIPHLVVSLSEDQQKLFAAMPEVFDRAIWDKKCREMNISVKTAEKWLRQFQLKAQILTKISHGRYKKITAKKAA